MANPGSRPASGVAPGRLDGIELLAGLTDDEVRALEQKCVWRIFRAGEQIFDRDSESRSIMFVVRGEVQVVNYSLSGREVAYAVVRAGGYFGELSAIDDEPRSASVVAIEDCLLAALGSEIFNDILQRHASVAVHVLRRLARIIRNCDDRIMDLSTLGAMQRVYRHLLRLAEPDPVSVGSWSIYPLPTQHSIAGEAGTTRETVARAFSQLAAAGIVERKGRTLYIRDKNMLERLIARLGQGEEGSLQ